MQHFTPRAPQMFGRKHKRPPFLKIGAAFGLLLGMLGAAWLGHATRPVEISTASNADSIVAPSPNSLNEASLRDAFKSSPAQRAVDYTAEKNPQKSATITITREAAFAQKLTSVQDKVQEMLSGAESKEEKKTLQIGKGDTLMELLVRANIPRNEAHEAIAALGKYYDPRDLNPSQSITVFFHRDPSIADPKFSGFEIEKDKISTVSVNRTDSGFQALQEDKSVSTRLRAYEGTIDSSLYVSAKAAGVPDSVILDMIKMYSYHVDFQRDIQGGDQFRVLYQESVTDAGDVLPGRNEIRYAQLTLGGKAMPLYYFKDSAGIGGFYDANGKSAKKALMRTPIDGARLSSGYGMRRHPVLGYSKMHKGVDFAAPTGTPIYAAGDGIIEKIGPFSSYGKYIRIRHGEGLSTAYAHMSRFNTALRAGARVRQGQVIGYVGSTGRSTGPHLHYEVMVNGAQVNPASVKTQSGLALAKSDLKKFKNYVEQMQSEVVRLRGEAAIAANSKSVRETTASN